MSIEDATVTGTVDGGSVNPLTIATFQLQFSDEPSDLPAGANDIVLFHKDDFDDDSYRLLFRNSGQTELWTTTDFDSLSKSSVISLSEPRNDGTILPDGTIVVVTSGTNNNSHVFSGDSFTSLSKVGQINDQKDPAVFYEADTDTVHYFLEESGTIAHKTAPPDDFANTTRETDAFSVPSTEYWGIGDVDVIEYGVIITCSLISATPIRSTTTRCFTVLTSTTGRFSTMCSTHA